MAQVQQVREVATTSNVVEESPADRGMTIAERIVSLIAAIIIGLLAIRFVLSLLGANRSNGFADFIYSTSGPLVSPFFGLFNYTPQFGVVRFEFETLIAMLFYALIAALIMRIVTIGRRSEA